MLYRTTEVVVCGIPDRFIEHATQEEQLHDLGLDAVGIAQRVRQLLEQRSSRRWWTRRFFLSR